MYGHAELKHQVPAASISATLQRIRQETRVGLHVMRRSVHKHVALGSFL